MKMIALARANPMSYGESPGEPGMPEGLAMSFARPELLWLLTILVPLSIWTIRGRWRRRKRWQSLAQRGRPSRDGTPGIVAAIVCLIVALAQPRWGHLPELGASARPRPRRS